MLDTARKRGPRLTALLSTAALGAFVQAAHTNGLICGLAGSVTADDIAGLSRLRPDYLGFRGALCGGAAREAALSLAAAEQVRACIDAAALPGGDRRMVTI